MNLTDFATFVINELDMYLPVNFGIKSTEAVEITTDKGETTKALIIRGGEDNARVMPYLDLSPYHASYSADRTITLEDIIQEIADDYRYYMDERPNPQFSRILGYDVDYDRHGKYIIPQLDNYEQNRDWIDKLPHRMIDDMAVTYHIYMNPSSIDKETFPISYSVLKEWNLTTEDIHTTALANSKTLLYVYLKDMLSVLTKIYTPYLTMDGQLSESDAISYVENEIIPQHFPDLKKGDAYLLSTGMSDYGAVTMICPHCQEMVKSVIEGDYFILPSSPHEVIVVPDRGQTPEMLAEVMINAYNELVPQDIYPLSKNVYRYDGQTHELTAVIDSKKYARNQSFTKEQELLQKVTTTVEERPTNLSRSKDAAAKHSLPPDNPPITSPAQRPISRFR